MGIWWDILSACLKSGVSMARTKVGQKARGRAWTVNQPKLAKLYNETELRPSMMN